LPEGHWLEEHVKLYKLRPFHHISNDAVHGGSKGFYRLGLMDDTQSKMLLVGPSNYGLADPIQNASISLLHVCACLLSIEPDFESIALKMIMNEYIKEICLKAVNVQIQIERDEANAH
jgi:hypothetical protein